MRSYCNVVVMYVSCLLTVCISRCTTLVIMGPRAGGIIFGTSTVQGEAWPLMEDCQMVVVTCCYTLRVLQITGTFCQIKHYVNTPMQYIDRGYSNFLLNMAFISPSEVENIYIS